MTSSEAMMPRHASGVLIYKNGSLCEHTLITIIAPTGMQVGVSNTYLLHVQVHIFHL